MGRMGRLLAALGVSVALAACGGGEPRASGGAQAKVLHRGNNAEPLTLDPHKANGQWENNIVGDLMMGLFTEDHDGKPVYGMAESHTVSSDGLVWTFKLRAAKWSDGEPVKAQDFVFAFQRLLDPKTAAQYASIQFVIKNAQAAYEGRAPLEAIGVKALDARTVRITLEHPAPYLPGLLTHYTAFPLPPKVVQEHGDAWVQPANIVVNGAYTLAAWRTNDFVHLKKNPNFFDADNVCLDEVYYYPTNDVNTAERRVRNGELDLNMEFPGNRIDFFRKEIPDYVRVHPYLSTNYLVFNITRPPFDDARVRRALAMAIDVEFITKEILRAGQEPAKGLVPPGIANYGDGAAVAWRGVALEKRKEDARNLLAAAGYGPDKPLRFEYTHRNTRDNPRIAPVLQQGWKDIAPWVQPDIAGIETQIHYDNLRARNFQVADAGWAADYNDPYNYLFLFETRAGPLNYPGWSEPEYDRLVAESIRELDVAKRAEIMARAEQILLDAAPIAPMWHIVNKALVNPRVTGWKDNAVDIHRSRYLCLSEPAK